MIVKMSRLNVYALRPELEKLVRGLMRKKCVQIDSPEQRSDYTQLISKVQHQGDSSLDFERDIARIAAAVKLLAPFVKKGGLFAKKSESDFDVLTDEANITDALEITEAVETSQKRISALKSEKNRISAIISSLTPWVSCDVPLDFSGSGSFSFFRFVLPNDTDLAALEEELNKSAPNSVLLSVSSDSSFKYVSLIACTSDADSACDVLKAFSAVKATLPEFKGTASEAISSFKNELDSLSVELSAEESAFKAFAEKLDVLKLGHDCLRVKTDCESVRNKALSTENVFIFSGWVPDEKKEKIGSFLDGFDCFYEFSEPTAEDAPPVLLKNGPLTESFEIITEMYGLPAPSGIDPNFMMGPFFCIFFGMMLSDAGYGLLLIAASIFALKCMQMGAFGKKFMKLALLCGISTVIWGAIYGGWFGNLIPAVASTFFGKTVTVPMLIDPLTEPVTILIISFVFGAIHLFCGMGIKFYLLCRVGKVWDAVFDIGSWYLVLLGLAALVLGGVIAKIGTIMAIAGALLLIITQGRGEKNIIKRFFKGLLSLYDITSYASDLLSYSRILALGMATGVIATVVNTIGTLFGGGIISAVLFIAIFIFGHLLNIAINALGSYVHSSRLQYVEFFGKFYEGGGKAFSPLKPNTKYTFFVNKEEN